MPLTIRNVCDAEYKAAKSPYIGGPCGSLCEGSCGPGLCQVRPSASQESAPRPLRAPRAVKAQGATRNAAQWQQIALHLADRVVNP